MAALARDWTQLTAQQQRQAQLARNQAAFHVSTRIDWQHYRAMPPEQQARYLQSLMRGHMTQLTSPYVQQAAGNLQRQLTQQAQCGSGGLSQMAQSSQNVMNQYLSQMTITSSMASNSTMGLSTFATGGGGTANSASNSVYVWGGGGGSLSTGTLVSGGAGGYIDNSYNAPQMMSQQEFDQHYKLRYDEIARKFRAPDWHVRDGERKTFHLPDGTIIEVMETGAFFVYDKDAKVIYRANRVRDFNRFMNVSDRLEEFIAFCGQQKVARDDFLALPITLFIQWLVIEAAKADQEPPSADIALIPNLRKALTARCTGCGRFLPRFAAAKKLSFCAPPCFERHYQRVLPVTPRLPSPASMPACQMPAMS